MAHRYVAWHADPGSRVGPTWGAPQTLGDPRDSARALGSAAIFPNSRP
jgi:hypothetical protein